MKRYQVVNRQRFFDRWADELARYPTPGSDPNLARCGPSGPRVLIIDHYTPRPDHDAGSERMVNFCSILIELGCHVTFVPDNRAFDGAYTRSMQAAGVEMLYHPHLSSLEDHLRVQGRHYDTVIMSRLDVADRSLEPVRRYCPSAKRVFDTVDLHFLRAQRRADVTGSHRDRAERLKVRELAVARACDVTLVVSPVEQQVLGDVAPDVRVKIVSLMITPDPTDTPFEQRAGLIFIGSFMHPPNCDAVEHYLERIHPLVRERLPGIPVTIIGDRPPASLRRLADDNVTFTGHVPDIRPLFSEARLSIAPIRFGAGLKGKIQTSLGYGVPVVTSTVGAEGMTLVDGEHILVADDPKAFADAVVSLHEDRDLWMKLSANGPAGVAGQCSLDHARDVIADLVIERNGANP